MVRAAVCVGGACLEVGGGGEWAGRGQRRLVVCSKHAAWRGACLERCGWVGGGGAATVGGLVTVRCGVEQEQYHPKLQSRTHPSTCPGSPRVVLPRGKVGGDTIGGHKTSAWVPHTASPTHSHASPLSPPHTAVPTHLPPPPPPPPPHTHPRCCCQSRQWHETARTPHRKLQILTPTQILCSHPGWCCQSRW